MRAIVDPERACRLVNHGPTVLVSAAHGGRRNPMAAAWSMPVEFAPPRIAVVVDKTTYTRELIAASGMLALCVPCRAQADLVWTVGSTSGRDAEREGTDKFRRYGIGWFDGPVLGLPCVEGCVEGCVAWMEARVIAEPHTEDAYDTFFVEVVSAQADPRVFADGRWSFREDNADLHTLSCSRSDWAPQLSALWASYRCIAIDLPGHGDTPAGDAASIAAPGASVNATLDALGVRDVVLIGHSMGCRVVSEACDRSRARVRGLVYVDGSFIEGEPAAIVAATEAKIDAAGIEPFLAGLYRDFHVAATPQAVRDAVGARRDHIDCAFARELVVDMVRWDSTRARAVLRTIGLPVLAIQSTLFDTEPVRVPVRAGELTPFSRVPLETVSGARIETITGGHFTMLEAPGETNALIRAFVEGLAERPGVAA